MKRSTTNQIKGKAREIKGDIKERLGGAMKNREMEGEGAIERLGGKLQKKAGDVEKRIDDRLEEGNE